MCDKKDQLLINKHSAAGLKHFKDSQAFTEYSSNMDKLCEEIEKHNPGKERKILILFANLIVLIYFPIKNLIQY